MIKKKIYGDTLKKQLIASAKDRLYNFLIAQGTVRGVIMNATRMVNEMRANHDLGILETLVLGHAYIGCGLMSTKLKGTDRVSLHIECSGPIKGLVVESNAFNEVRGYLKSVPIPLEKTLENFNLSPFFGAGFLTVTKHLEDHKQPFAGKIMLEYGSIAQDLANYYLKSEQVPTAFNLSIQFDSEGNVTGAGGMFLQAMPDAKEKDISRLEEMVNAFPSIGAALAKDRDPVDLVKEAFSEYSPEFLADRRVEFMCHCKKERMLGYLSTLPKNDLKDILEEETFPIEIRCHNCNTFYYFDESEIREIYLKRMA